jgi:metallo-beta-lactamase family protein
MQITFLGAAGEVTGSQHLIETDALRLLLDCGFFQGHRAEAYRKNKEFHCKPRKLDGVILSHAHIDHCGNLPGLYRAGYRGPIFCTEATADIAEIMLEDSAKIQEEDARYLSKRLKGDHPPVEPLYTVDDLHKMRKQFEPLEYDEWHELSSELSVRFRRAGHILGSAITEMNINDDGEIKRVVFSGDLGRRSLPLLHDPETVERADVVICESTYGNRVHVPPGDLKEALRKIIDETAALDGKVVIPAFSLGRTQQVVYFLNELFNARELPNIPVYVDSPLATRLTNVFRYYQTEMDAEVVQELGEDEDGDVFSFPKLYYTRSQEESIALNRRSGPFVVISASGMCEAGRIRHHLKHAVEDENNTIVIIGFQAQNTLGRRIVERQPRIRMFDQDYKLRARVEVLNGLSAHADAHDFEWWFRKLCEAGGAGQVFLVHGEEEAAKSLANLIHDMCDNDPIIPQRFDTFEV